MTITRKVEFTTDEKEAIYEAALIAEAKKILGELGHNERYEVSGWSYSTVTVERVTIEEVELVPIEKADSALSST